MRCNDMPPFSSSVGERKIMNHFVSRIEERSSANARQLLAEQHVDDPRAADTRFHQHHPGVITDDFSDDVSVTPEKMLAHLPEYSRCRVRSDDRQQFALVSHIKRIQPENLAGPFDGLPHRDLSLVDNHADP